MSNRNQLQKLAYISFSLLLSVALFSPVHSAPAAQKKSCHYTCLHSLKGAGSNRAKLKKCEDNCEAMKPVM